jgi:hypothetical protein
MGKKVEKLKNHPDLFANLVDVYLFPIDIDTVYDNLAAVDLLKPVEAPEKGALSRSTGPDDDNNLALFYAGRKIHQGLYLPAVGGLEGLVNVSSFNH